MSCRKYFNYFGSNLFFKIKVGTKIDTFFVPYEKVLKYDGVQIVHVCYCMLLLLRFLC